MNKIPRWRVRLILTLWDAATGALLVVGTTFVLAVLAIWVWAAVDGPWFIAWPLRVAAAFLALVWLGRVFDRYMDRRAARIQSAPSYAAGAVRHPVYMPPEKRIDETRP